MLNLFWIFEHVTGGPFNGPLSVNFAHTKGSPETFGHMSHFAYASKWNFPLNFRTMRKLSDLYSVHYA